MDLNSPAIQLELPGIYRLRYKEANQRIVAVTFSHSAFSRIDC
jgi:hypothetical protein